MPRTDKDIEAEAKLAVNGVIRTHQRADLDRLRQNMRKAFPFGPGASSKEKRIWEEVVKRALEECGRWPQTLAALLLMMSLSILPAFCDSFVKTDKQWYRVTDDATTQISVAPNEVPLKTRAGNTVKVGFRKVRRGCQIANPLLQAAGHVAYILYLLIN